jgi:epsilon-lactone hydrolase
LLDQGYKPQNIVIAGDSAGGNLTLVTLLALRDQGLPLPAAGVLISPWADLTCSGDTLATNADDEPMIPINALRFVSASYSRGEDPAAPMLSPIYADLSGLPPLMIQVSAIEVLLSDAERVAQRALDCGVSCRYQVWEGMIHVFQALAGWVPEASLAVQELGAFVDEQIRAAGGEHQLRRRARVVTGLGR